MKIGVIADDLTGALDTGLEFWKNGLRTITTTSPQGPRRFAGSAEVIVMDTGTRSSSPRKARQRAAEAARLLEKFGARFFYKKIDSTLRGNLGAEIDAVMDELNVGATILAPALPEQGRTTVGGHVFVGGKRLDKTSFARELNSALQSHVPSLLVEQTHKRVGSIPLSFVRGDLGNELDVQRRKGARIIVVDAVTRGDLRRIAEFVARRGLGRLWCGSAGFAAEVPAALGLCKRPLPTLVLSGSLNQVTRLQVRRIDEILGHRMTGLSLDSLYKEGSARKFKKDLDAAILAIRNGQDTVLYFRDGGSRKLGPRYLEKALSSFRSTLNRIVGGKMIEGLVVVGGETAAQACRALGAKAMSIEDEPYLGLACARILDGRNKGLRIVTKAGGFGGEDALVRAVNYLKMRRP